MFVEIEVSLVEQCELAVTLFNAEVQGVPMLLSVETEGVFFKFFAKIICDSENFINFVGA